MKNTLKSLISFLEFYLLFPSLLLLLVFALEYFSISTTTGLISIVFVLGFYQMHLFLYSDENVQRSKSEFIHRHIICGICAHALVFFYVKNHCKVNEITSSIFFLYLSLIAIVAIIAMNMKNRKQENRFFFFLHGVIVLTGVLAMYVFWSDSRWVFIAWRLTYWLAFLLINPRFIGPLESKIGVFLDAIIFRPEEYALVDVLFKTLFFSSFVNQFWVEITSFFL
jgi:hypothetical protein